MCRESVPTECPLNAPSAVARAAPQVGLWAGCLLLAWSAGAEPADIALRGRLLGPEGTPAAGVEMRLVAPEDAYQRALRQLEDDQDQPAGVDSTVTDGDGRWSLAAPPGRYAVLALTSRWQATGQTSLPGVPDAAHTTRSLVEADVVPDAELGRGCVLRITVTAGGEPVAGARVHAMAWDRRRERLTGLARWARTDDAGVATLPAFDGERLRVEVTSPAGVSATAENVGGDHRMALEPGSPRQVRVEDAAGRPVAGALLVYGAGDVPVAQTDDTGMASLRTTGTGLSITALSADGGRGGGLVAASDDDAPQVLVLEPTHTISGRVIDQRTREPVAGALVWQPGGDEQFARSDGAGGYSLAVRTRGSVGLRADASGYFSGGTDVPAGGVQAPTLALEPSAHLDGRVVDRGGEPLAGVRVQADLQMGTGGMFRSRPTSTATDSRGVFRLGGLVAGGTYALEASLDGYASASSEVAVGEDGSPPPVEIVLGRGVRAFGRVTDEDDVPVAGATVSLEKQGDGNPMARMVRAMRGQAADAEAVADGDGLFTFPNLAAGRYSLTARAPGYAPATVPGVEMLEGDGGDAESDLGTLVLSPGVSVHGIVTDSDGEPLTGAQIVARAGQGGMVRVFTSGGSAPADAVSGDDGTFVVADQAPGGQVALSASLAGYQSNTVDGVRAPNDEPARIVLQQSGQVAGRVTDDSGLPVAGAMVSASIAGGRGPMMRMMRSAPTQSDSDGRFLLENVAPSQLEISAAAEGYQQAKVGVEVAEGEVTGGVELVLRPGARIVGTVFGNDGLPVIGARVALDSGEGGPGPMMFRGRSSGTTETDGDGNFVLDGLATGTHTVVASKDQQRTSRVVEVRGGSQRLDLRFQSGVLVSGRVVDSAGLPVPAAALTLQSSEDFSSRISTESQADGSFRFADVAPGTYHLTGQASGLARSRSQEPIQVAAKPVAGVELRLTPAQALVGRLLGADFDDLGSAQVLAVSESGLLMAEVDFEGRYRIDGLAAGDWLLDASLPDGRRASERVTLEEGVPETVKDLDFDAGEALAGTVTADSGPVQGLTVSVRGIDVEGSGLADTDTSGRFRFEGLEPGRYRISVFDRQDGRSATTEAQVPGPEVDLELVSLLVTGRVLGWDGGPLSGATIKVRRVGDDQERNSFERLFGATGASSDDTGRFRLQGLAPGSFEVTVSKAGYATATQPLEVVGDGTSLEITLEPAEGLWLTVRRDDGAVVPKVSLVVLDGAGATVAGGDFVPDDQGRVFLSTVPPGSVRVVVQAPGTAPVELDVRVPDERPTAVLTQGAQLEVVVPELFDDPVRADATLTGWDGQRLRVPGFGGTVQDSFRVGGRLGGGRVSVPAVAPGAWTVTVTAADGRSWSQTVQVPGPGRLEVRLE